jgi:hypothetical protein
MEPANASMCMTANLVCPYGTTNCTCAGFGGGGTRWNCIAPCPAAEPTPGAMCATAAGMTCTYGMVACQCRAAMAGAPTTWFCN